MGRQSAQFISAFTTKYTLLNDNKTVFASKYKLCLPTEEELKKEIMRERTQIEQEKNLAAQKTI